MTAPRLTPAELAERLQVPIGTVYRWNSTGTGPRYFRAGRHVRYRLDDVEAWEQEQFVQPAPGGGGQAA